MRHVPALLLLLPGALLGWEPAAEPPIGVRNAHVLAYDGTRQGIVLFGGSDEAQVRGDTWIWRGRGGWTRLMTTGPGPRTFPAMGYDEVRREIVLFGGNRVLFGTDAERDTFLADTWVLGAEGWTARPGTGPTARSEAAMTFDPLRGRIVLFGGSSTVEGARVRYGDTWEWDGFRWTRVAETGPAARNGTTLAFDVRRQTVVLSGGPPAIVGPDSWEWDGTTWRTIPVVPPPGHFNPALAPFPPLGQIVRFAGWTGRERSGDTWVLDASGWQELRVPGPSARNHSSMAFDPLRSRIVLMGGHDGTLVFGDTWEFDGRSWQRMADAVPLARVDNGH